MPKEAFGGDDEGSTPPEEKKKMGLHRFGLSPDTNIRDVFWKIMGSYAATKKPGMEFSEIENERFSLMRVGISVLSNEQSEQYGLSPRFVAIYLIMMLIDGGWQDAFSEFLERGYDAKRHARDEIAQAMKKLITQEKYREEIQSKLSTMLRGKSSASVALAYLAMIESSELSRAMKKELLIIARGDIGDNQMNAIKAISLLKEEEDVKKSLIVLLSHWDAQARLAAAEVLSEMGQDREVKNAALKKLEGETDPDVKAYLRKAAGMA